MKGLDEDCWLYTKCISTWGYGRVPNRKSFISAHRFSYQLHKGAIPEGMFVCHHCDNPPCVNPKHLFLGTCADNNKDKLNKGRTFIGTKHWKSKLNEEQVRDIKKQLSNGRTGYQIGKQYNVSHQAIYSIKYGVNWGWLDNACK